MKLVVLSIIVCLGIPSAAQTYPDAPSINAGLRSALPAESTDRSSIGAAPPIRSAAIRLKGEFDSRKLPRVLDERFFVANAFMLAGMAADNISTRRGLARGCKEGSPLLGPHPSLGKELGVSAAEAAGLIALGYGLKKMLRNEEPGVERNIWMIVPIMDGALHGFAATVVNAGKNCR
jgi:hypothetical protein